MKAGIEEVESRNERVGLYLELEFSEVYLTLSHFIDWREQAGAQAEKFYKRTLWEGEHVMVGLNCLEPGQAQRAHAHEGADKFYFVLEGRGRFTVGTQERDAAAGTVVIAPAGVSHGVVNTGDERLSLLVAIAPGIK